jgi:ABC-2 type transport system permease protein
MSTAITARPVARPTTYPPTGLGRLTRIELRKAVDTRAGRWLLIAVAAIAIIMTGVAILAGGAKDHTFHRSAGLIQSVISVLLPVIGILLVTSEWSQRTALQTFALVPRRGRIISAKLLAGTGISVVVAVVALGLGAVATAIASHPAGGAWHNAGEVALGGILVQLLSLLMGMAFGLALLSSAPAIVLSFVLPTVWAALASSIHALHGVQPWLDSTKTSTYLLDGDLSARHWAQIGVTTLIWIAVPLAAGLARLRRHEIA